MYRLFSGNGLFLFFWDLFKFSIRFRRSYNIHLKGCRQLFRSNHGVQLSVQPSKAHQAKCLRFKKIQNAFKTPANCNKLMCTFSLLKQKFMWGVLIYFSIRWCLLFTFCRNIRWMDVSKGDVALDFIYGHQSKGEWRCMQHKFQIFFFLIRKIRRQHVSSTVLVDLPRKISINRLKFVLLIWQNVKKINKKIVKGVRPFARHLKLYVEKVPTMCRYNQCKNKPSNNQVKPHFHHVKMDQCHSVWPSTSKSVCVCSITLPIYQIRRAITTNSWESFTEY